MNHVFCALLSFCALSVAITATAARADESPLFDYREITLDNGLRVITLEDLSCPIVNVQLWYHVGSKDENPARQGFAHMFEHMMFRGTDRLGPTDHFDLIRRTGGSSNAYTSFDQTVYHETVPANQLDLALWLEAERMTFLKIDQASFDTERQVVEEERRLGVNQPYGTLLEKMLAELFHEHPYRWSPIGNIPHLRAASVSDVRDFWTRFYVPNNATLVIVGAVKHEQAQELARRYFGWVPRYPDQPRVTVREPAQAAARTVTIKEDSAPAPLVGLLFRTVPLGHPDAIPLQLLGTILGGGQSSRLYRELVAEKELAVMAAAGAWALEQDAIFAAGAVLQPFGGDPAKVLAALEAQLERVRTEPVTEPELTKARNQMLKGVVEQNLTIVSKASALGSAAVLEGNAARVNERLAAIRRVTPDDLQRCAKTYLAPERGTAGTVQQNMLGALGSMLGFKKKEETPPITAQPETEPPPPGRAGLTRPAGFPTTAPVVGPVDYDPTPKFNATTLPTGLKVLVVENHEVPFVTIQLGLRPGAWTETKPGTAALALGMLTRGTTEHTEGELATELETNAISLSGGAGMDNSTVYADCLPEQVDRAVRLMAEVVRRPTFPPDEFRKLHKQVRTGLVVAHAEPSYVAERELRRVLYGEHPYARTESGEIEDVDALRVEDAREWWQRFARPDLATLIFAGDITPERAKQVAEAHFADWRAEGTPPQTTVAPLPEPAATRIYLVDRPGIQSQIRVGQLGITRKHAGYFISRVVSGYFGGAFSSRLNETIRVKKGMTYGAHGGYGAQQLAGDFEISTFSKVDRTVEAVRAIFDEVKRLQDEPPSAEELEKTKSYTLGSFPGQRETPQAVAGDLWLIESQELPPDYLQRLLKGVTATTAEDCTRLVKETIDPAKMAVVVVGPASMLRAGLEEIAPVTIITPKADEPEKAPAEEAASE